MIAPGRIEPFSHDLKMSANENSKDFSGYKFCLLCLGSGQA
jgi:hypothetical protein